MVVLEHLVDYRRSVFVDGYIAPRWFQRQLESASQLEPWAAIRGVRAEFCERIQEVWWRTTQKADQELAARHQRLIPGADVLCLEVTGPDAGGELISPPMDVVQEANNERYMPLCFTLPSKLDRMISVPDVLEELPYVLKPASQYEDLAGVADFSARLSARLAMLYDSPSHGAAGFLRREGGLVQRSICGHA